MHPPLSLQAARERAEISRAVLAERLGVDIPRVWRWEVDTTSIMAPHQIVESAQVLGLGDAETLRLLSWAAGLSAARADRRRPRRPPPPPASPMRPVRRRPS